MAEQIKDQGTQQASQLDPEQKFKIKVQGQEKEVPLSELLELAQKGDDYTKKTQELSEKERKLEEETQRKAEELAYQYLEQVETEQKSQQPKVEVDESLDPQEKRIRQLEGKIDKLEKGSEQREIAQHQLRIENTLKDLNDQYPMEDIADPEEKKSWGKLRDRLALTAMVNDKTGRLKMEDVFKDIHNELTERRDKTRQNYLKDKEKQPKTEGGGPSRPPITPEKPLTAKDFMSGEVKRQAADAIRKELE